LEVRGKKERGRMKKKERQKSESAKRERKKRKFARFPPAAAPHRKPESRAQSHAAAGGKHMF
jgi:hypothetical protein